MTQRSEQTINRISRKLDKLYLAVLGDPKTGNPAYRQRIEAAEKDLMQLRHDYQEDIRRIEKRFEKLYQRVIGISIGVSIAAGTIGWTVDHLVQPTSAAPAGYRIEMSAPGLTGPQTAGPDTIPLLNDLNHDSPIPHD
jgi:hypothetical protein